MNRTGLIVNADDFGLTEPVNRGIMQAIEQGIVSSVSLVANGHGFADACRFLKEHPHISAGWHVNLTSGLPALDAAMVPSLVDKHGLFPGKLQFLFRLYTGRINHRECRAELTAQYDRLIRADIAITHVDSHHDVHCVPFVSRILQRVYNQKNTPVRFQQGTIQYLDNNPGNVLSRLLVKFIARGVKKTGCSEIDFIWFRELYQHSEKFQVLKSCLQKMKKGINLLICHPGYSDTANELRLLYNEDRHKELIALCRQDLRVMIKQLDIELISYHQIGYEAYL